MAIKPVILKAGDTFGIVTLGSPLSREIIDERINFLRNMGFKVLIGQHVYSYAGYIAATPQQRASDLMQAFMNESIRVILPTRGGVGVSGILPYLNYNIIRRNPKILTGYSDITILLNVLYQKADLITFSSLLLIDFRNDTPAYNYDQFFAATSTLVSPRYINNPPGIPLISRVLGNVTGRVVGGNLTSFAGTLGTPYEIDVKGKILFLEETHAPINTVYRYLNHLILAGKFRDCIGIIIGECTECEPAYERTYENLIQEVIVPLGKPLITNLTAAHGVYKATVPIGANVNLNTFNNTIRVLEPAVKI